MERARRVRPPATNRRSPGLLIAGTTATMALIAAVVTSALRHRQRGEGFEIDGRFIVFVLGLIFVIVVSWRDWLKHRSVGRAIGSDTARRQSPSPARRASHSTDSSPFTTHLVSGDHP